MIEGMIIFGYTIGVTYGIIYLRGEYRWLKNKLDEAIQEYHAGGLLGKDCGQIKGFDSDIRIQMGAGSYVCGEETALLESLEGKRGEPRTKWFFPVEKGYLQLPAIINNVETFCAAARIIEMGAAIANKYSVVDKKVFVAVDNTYTGPLWQHPLKNGPDPVMYSATKYIRRA